MSLAESKLQIFGQLLLVAWRARCDEARCFLISAAWIRLTMKAAAQHAYIISNGNFHLQSLVVAVLGCIRVIILPAARDTAIHNLFVPCIASTLVALRLSMHDQACYVSKAGPSINLPCKYLG